MWECDTHRRAAAGQNITETPAMTSTAYTTHSFAFMLARTSSGRYAHKSDQAPWGAVFVSLRKGCCFCAGHFSTLAIKLEACDCRGIDQSLQYKRLPLPHLTLLDSGCISMPICNPIDMRVLTRKQKQSDRKHQTHRIAETIMYILAGKLNSTKYGKRYPDRPNIIDFTELSSLEPIEHVHSSTRCYFHHIWNWLIIPQVNHVAMVWTMK